MNANLKYALKALNNNDNPILVFIELDIDKLEVHVKTRDSRTMEDSEIKSEIDKWNKNEEIDSSKLSENTIIKFTDESILPDNIKLEENSFKLRQIQNEWSYAILNSKLFQQFNTELDIIKQKAAEISSYNHDLFVEVKDFWEKLLEYKKEKEITQDKLNYFKEEINTVFDKLKLLKEKYILEKDEKSNIVFKDYSKRIQEVYDNIEKENVHFNSQIDILKEMQQSLKEQDIKRELKNQLYNDFQKLFEAIQAKRKEKFGDHASSRVQGLKNAKAKIEKSLNYDLKDLKFNEGKIAKANNRLEEQLRGAKIQVLKDKIESKKEKIADISKTLKKLEDKLSNNNPETDSVNEKTENVESEKPNENPLENSINE